MTFWDHIYQRDTYTEKEEDLLLDYLAKQLHHLRKHFARITLAATTTTLRHKSFRIKPLPTHI